MFGSSSIIWDAYRSGVVRSGKGGRLRGRLRGRGLGRGLGRGRTASAKGEEAEGDESLRPPLPGVKEVAQGVADSEPSSSKEAGTLSGPLWLHRRILTRSVSICSESSAGLTLDAVQFLHFTGTSTVR